MKLECTKCKKLKPEDRFYRCNGRNTGRQIWCKNCGLDQSRKYRKTKKFKQYRREYHQRGYVKARIRAYTAKPEVRQKRGKQCRESYLRNKGRYKARYLSAHKRLHLAVKRGLLTPKPCQICGKHPAEGHHPNYKKPLEVIWLCRSHHQKLHRLYAR